MLASLLPGLRDVRTPLAVGYLWLLTTWLVFGEHVPKDRPSGNGLVAQLFDLGGILGRAAPVVALSFIAYLLGALLTIPVESRLISSFLRRMGDYSFDTRSTTEDYRQRQVDLYVECSEHIRANPGFEFNVAEKREFGDLEEFEERIFAGDTSRSLYLRTNDLRARLLVTNEHMYGEYDRLAAEASFRVNMTLPMMALGLLVTFNLNVLLALGIMTGATVLLVQGAGRQNLSNTVLRRAVLDGVVKDPVFDKLEGIIARTSAPPQTPRAGHT